MEDTSFLYFTQEEVLDQINIDPRLVDSFKRVMKTIQEYFNANGYTQQRNYKEYLQKYLLGPATENMWFCVGKMEDPRIGGYYNKSKQSIWINENKLRMLTDELDSTLCHEFIHFLVMHGLIDGTVDAEIYRGGFINEALTEMLTQQMYPNSNAYDSQVSMHKYANLLSGNVNNYSRFLQGFIDARYSSHQWLHYEAKTRAFQRDFNAAGYITLAQAQNNANFVDAQRELIELFIRPTENKTFEEYFECLQKLSVRPVKDQEYINQIVSVMDKHLIDTLHLKSPTVRAIFEKRLTDVKVLMNNIKKYGGKKVYEFEFAGRTLAIDESGKLYGNSSGITIGRSLSPRSVYFVLGNERLNIEMDKIDFSSYDISCREKLDEFDNLYSKDSTVNLSMIEKALGQPGELVKIEKFTLPVIGSDKRKKPDVIYVATYPDRVVILNDNVPISTISNIPLNRYIGVTSKDPQKSAIYMEELGTINNAVAYTTLNSGFLAVKVIAQYAKELEGKISEEELAFAMERFKSSELYSEDDDLETIKEYALKDIAKERYDTLLETEKQELIKAVEKEKDKFAISINNGKVDVALLFGEQYVTAYCAEEQVLYDSKTNAIYNEVVEELKKSRVISNNTIRSQIGIDPSGNMVVPPEGGNITNKPTEEDLRKALDLGIDITQFKDRDELYRQIQIAEQQKPVVINQEINRKSV